MAQRAQDAASHEEAEFLSTQSAPPLAMHAGSISPNTRTLNALLCEMRKHFHVWTIVEDDDLDRVIIDHAADGMTLAEEMTRIMESFLTHGRHTTTAEMVRCTGSRSLDGSRMPLVYFVLSGGEYWLNIDLASPRYLLPSIH